jgi:hypothetical protein
LGSTACEARCNPTLGARKLLRVGAHRRLCLS